MLLISSCILIIIICCYVLKHSNRINKKRNYYPYFVYKPNLKNIVQSPLIYGFAYGYNWDKIRLFAISLRKCNYKGDLIMPISTYSYTEMKNKLKEYNIMPILLEDEWPFYSSQNKLYPINRSFLQKCMIESRNYRWKWAIYRFSILLCWMGMYGNKYSHIISLDVRDIIFQGNPFDWNFEDGLYIVDETYDNIFIKNDSCNLNWVKCYRNYSNVVNNKILNVGTILGSYSYFLSFLNQFCKFIRENSFDTAEQGSLNYAYYSGYFKNIKFHMNRNQKGVVLTTGLDLSQVMKLNMSNKNIYNIDGTIALIVHQYDRSKKLVNIYKNKYLN